MSDETITDFIRASRELCDKATPGPYRAAQYHDKFWYVIYGENGYAVVNEDGLSLKADAEFHAHARTALPRALDMLERVASDACDIAMERDMANAHIEDLNKQLAEQQAEIARLEAAYANQVAAIANAAFTRVLNGSKP